MTDEKLKFWVLKVKEKYSGDLVKLFFELYYKSELKKKWEQTCNINQVKARVDAAKRESKEYARHYGEVKKYLILLENDKVVNEDNNVKSKKEEVKLDG